MILLTFAHRPEAKAFLSHFKNLKSYEDFKDLYVSEVDDLALLLTGEGILSSATSLTQALTLLPKIKKIINLGVAGALNPSLEVGEILIGKIAYGAKDAENKKMHFKSFQLDEILENIKTYDIVSAEERVLNSKEKNYYSNFGDIVDREIWGLAYSAQQFKKPISSIKIISDSKEDESFCQIVKVSALKFSNDLLNFYLDHIHQQKKQTNNRQISDFENYLITHPNIFLTIAQKNLLKKFAKKIKLNEKLIHEIEAIINSMEAKRPKDISKSIFDFFEKTYSPTIYQLNKLAKEKIFSLNSPNIKFSPDPIFETSEITFCGQIKSENDKQQVIAKLNNLPFEKWSEIINGEDIV